LNLGFSKPWVRRMACAAVAVAGGCAAFSQGGAVQRTFHRPKAEVEKALVAARAYSGGRLPILDGFAVAGGDEPLDKFRRGFYQYVIQVNSIGSQDTMVKVNAKITAWYAAEIPSDAGYKVLGSNGRLEADLLDRLGESLGSAASERPLPSTPSVAAHADAKSPGSGAFSLHRDLALPARGAASAPDRRLEQLTEQQKTFEQILKNQAHPDNLAVVKQSKTPVFQRPQENGAPLFLADAEDEFQIINMTENWVHVQISGISRGWIRRSQLALPSAYGEGANVLAELHSQKPFRQMRQETSIFPGNWEPLKGKKVKIIWVQASGGAPSDDASKLSFTKTVFRREYPELTRSEPPLAGVVVVFDSQDGGMAAATFASLQQWSAHHLSDRAFWERCWFDPADAFKLKD
jgi:hypothetical protein